jgi:hypothetical protein
VPGRLETIDGEAWSEARSQRPVVALLPFTAVPVDGRIDGRT